MNYPNELKERYNEVMVNECEIIEKFLESVNKKSRGTCDSWHFEPSIPMMNLNGHSVIITDVKLGEMYSSSVLFRGVFNNKSDWYKCDDFQYGELRRLIQALPDVSDVAFDDEIMNTLNGHNPRLVKKINDAWNCDECKGRFGDILLALACRDDEEVYDKLGIHIDCNEMALENAHEILENICDDWDLETVLGFVRYA